MTKYEKLLIESEELGAKVYEIDFSTEKPCAKCKGKNIYINIKATDKEKYCLLLEELGHYLTTYGNILDQTRIENRKQELFARRWGYEHSVTLVGIINAFEYGAQNTSDIAEFLGVTERFLEDSIKEYGKKYGVRHKVDNYIIDFIPNFGIGKSFV